MVSLQALFIEGIIFGYNFSLSLKQSCVRKERISEIIERH